MHNIALAIAGHDLEQRAIDFHQHILGGDVFFYFFGQAKK